MSSIANNNTTNNPSINNSSPPSGLTWGQAGCGSVGYSYSAIIAAMNALQSLVTLSSTQAQYQAEIGSLVAQQNAQEIIAQAQDNADATTDQAWGQIAAGGTAIVTTCASYLQTRSSANEANSLTTQQKTFENLQEKLPAPSTTPEASVIGAQSNKPVGYENGLNPNNPFNDPANTWKPEQIELYDALTKPNATAKQINTALEVNGLTTDEITQVAESIDTPNANKTAQENLAKGIASTSNNARVLNDQVSSTTQRMTTLSQGLQSLSTGIAGTFQSSKQLTAGQAGAASAVLQNAQSINNNQLQNSVGYIGKAYDEELTSLQMLGNLAQASHV